jgi:hypothetical protein
MRRRAPPRTDPKNANDPVDTLLQQPDPLDEAEQEAVVRALREQAEAQQARGSAAVAVVSTALALLLSWLALEQLLLHPYQQMHTAELRTVVEGWAIKPGFVLAVQAGGLWAAAARAVAGRRRNDARSTFLRLAAALGASVGAVYWFLAILAHARKYPSLAAPWELSWLPVAPAFVVGVGEAASSAFAATRAEVEALAQLRYAHKRV